MRICTGYCRPHPDQYGEAVGRSYSAWRRRSHHRNCGSLPMANQSQAPLRDDDAIFERRAKGRTTINRDVLMFFTGQDRVVCTENSNSDVVMVKAAEDRV
jgi:hypothetical protein